MNALHFKLCVARRLILLPLLVCGWIAVASTLRAGPPPLAPTQKEVLPFEQPDSTRLLLPPGPFTDGHEYDLSQLKGKVVVLLYVDPRMPDAVAVTQERLSQMRIFAGRPIKVLGIARGDINGVRNGFRGMKGTLPPTNFDSTCAFSALWFINGRSQSFSVFDPDGKVCVWSGMQAFVDTVTTACDKAIWRYKDDGYNKAPDPALDLLEWNHYAEGLKLLRPLLKDGRKPVAESAEKLYAAIKAEGDTWKADAEKSAGDDPVKAYDLYTRLAGAFPGEDLGKAATDAIKTLKADKRVADELAARAMLAQFVTLPFDNRHTPSAASELLGQLMTKYPQTPSAARAKIYRQAIPPMGI